MHCPEAVRRVSRARRLALAVGLVVVVVSPVAVACTDDDGAGGEAEAPPVLSLPDPAPIEDAPVVTMPEGFVMPDTRGARLLPVVGRGESVPPLPVFGGEATLVVQVDGPDGPLGGATIRLERMVGDRRGVELVQAGPNGRYTASNLHGGRYRVRAWRQPDLTATEAEVVFLAADRGRAEVTIATRRFDSVQLQAAPDVTAVAVGGSARIRALLTRESVDEQGIVIGAPIAGAELRLVVEGGFTVTSANPVATGGDGTATFTVTCDREGNHRMTVTGPAVSTVVNAPACTPRPADTTTSTSLVVPDFPVGSEFTVPHGGVLPAGTYQTFLEGCGISYEVFENGAWQPGRREATGQTVTFATPVRDLEPLPGTDGCRYRRIA